MNEYYKTCKFAKPTIKKHKRETVKDSTYYRVWNACNGTCQLCGTKQNLEMHHILGRGKELTNNYKLCIHRYPPIFCFTFVCYVFILAAGLLCL